MVLWSCNIRVSWRTQLVCLLAHGALILLILLFPWPESYGLYWLIPLILLVFACIRSQRQIAKTRGELRVMPDNIVQWQGQTWLLCHAPRISDFGILLVLKQEENGQRKRLWLAADSMFPEQWRHLRRLLLYPQSAHE